MTIKIRCITAPTSEGIMYAVYGANKASREKLAARLGKPYPGGHFILSPTAFAELKAEFALANA